MRDTDGAVRLQIVFKERDEHTGRSHHGVVEGVGKVLFAVRAVDTDLESSCLRVAEVGAGAHLEIFLLTGRPRLYVYRLHLEVGKVTGAALKRSYRDIHGAEQIHGILPELIVPHHAVLGLADNDHFLLLELMDAVNAALLDAVRALFLAEAG